MDLFFTKIAYAAPSTNLNEFIANVDNMIINPLILFIFALAVIYFLYGVYEFIANGSNEEKKTTGKSHMIWGIIGITIMIGVWTILNILLSTMGITTIKPETSEVKLPPYVPPVHNNANL